MVREVMLHTSNDLEDSVRLACTPPLDTGVHTVDNQITGEKSVLGLTTIDYKRPAKVVPEDRELPEQLDRWAVDKDI